MYSTQKNTNTAQIAKFIVIEFYAHPLNIQHPLMCNPVTNNVLTEIIFQKLHKQTNKQTEKHQGVHPVNLRIT